MSASSISSSIDVSIRDFPAIVLANLPKKLSFVFLRPISNFSLLFSTAGTSSSTTETYSSTAGTSYSTTE